ncbi:PH domain-containing protein [Vaginella massiliensis]|uniref:PH domain-containing protein n=1 Tax=Vaginella massiliensis TaxID=1816680 RepID=UPI0037536B90
MGLFDKLLGNAGTVMPEKLYSDYQAILIEGETIDIGFSLFRDVFMFTSKRLILIDKQGLTGRKIEYLSLPYSSISRFSIETAGNFDLDAELKIWISSEDKPSVSKKFNKSVNVYEVQRVLAQRTLK